MLNQSQSAIEQGKRERAKVRHHHLAVLWLALIGYPVPAQAHVDAVMSECSERDLRLMIDVKTAKED